jgi:hypothetical protein
MYIPLGAHARQKAHLNLKEPLDIGTLTVALHSELASEFNQRANGRRFVHVSLSRRPKRSRGLPRPVTWAFEAF